MDLSICKYCGAHTVWMKTKQNKPIMVDLTGITAANIKQTVFEKGAFTPHFTTCPNNPPRAEQPANAPYATAAAAPNSSHGGPRASAEQEYRSQQDDKLRQFQEEYREMNQPPDDVPPPPLDDDTF